ncbi:helix-turn-helix domain-containing protein [Acetobacter cerevisiae]|uniref:helix-turn-helix domain-containing protein n=1 Tax=Acetobacter cerevisiae TaxID=178900 RepID=UPI0009EECC86
MSARARDWAYSVTLPLCQKFVLVALAERANDEGVAWPSARTISDMTGACDKAVRNALKQLEQDGFIVRVSSGTRSKTYQLSLNRGNEIPVSGTGQPARHTGQPVRDTAVLDTGYPVPHTTQPVSGTGQTGTTYRQTVSIGSVPLRSIRAASVAAGISAAMSFRSTQSGLFGGVCRLWWEGWSDR